MHKDHYFPELTDRNNREIWEADGRLSIEQKARIKVNSILDSPPDLKLKKEAAVELYRSFPQIRFSQFPGYN
jgi:trimethylamine:corrinoid methyltransferase-like protein